MKKLSELVISITFILMKGIAGKYQNTESLFLTRSVDNGTSLMLHLFETRISDMRIRVIGEI